MATKYPQPFYSGKFFAKPFSLAKSLHSKLAALA